jgi:N-formylglutamate amidohydrolase
LSLRRSEDAYVDELFAGAAAHGALVVSASVARAYVDLNRDPSELDPEMFEERLPHGPGTATPRVQAGLGAIPKVTGDGQAIYRGKLSLADAQGRIARVHRPYHALLQNLVLETRAEFGCALLVDCHSMPSGARGAHAPDIVLGDRDGSTCSPAFTALVREVMQGFGYSVKVNDPFKGVELVRAFADPARGRHCLQLEINKRLYMDEKTLQKSANFAPLQAQLMQLLDALHAAFHA